MLQKLFQLRPFLCCLSSFGTYLPCFLGGCILKKRFVKSRVVRMQKYFKRKREFPKRIRASLVFPCLEITINHPLPCLLYYIHVEYDSLLDGVPR